MVRKPTYENGGWSWTSRVMLRLTFTWSEPIPSTSQSNWRWLGQRFKNGIIYSEFIITQRLQNGVEASKSYCLRRVFELLFIMFISKNASYKGFCIFESSRRKGNLDDYNDNNNDDYNDNKKTTTTTTTTKTTTTTTTTTATTTSKQQTTNQPVFLLR